MKATVFLGAGRITGALVAGLHLGGYKRPIIVYDRNPEKLRALRRAFPVEAVRDLATAVERAEILVVAVQPSAVAELLDEVIRCGVTPSALAVGLAAGIPLRTLRARLKPPSHGYHALATLAKAAEGSGLDSKTSLAAAAHALAEGILYWRDSKKGLTNLLHEAATPGGTAAATMKAMDKAGYGKAIARGLQAGVAQARRNARRT
jgi:pyrroline-5-carboxylate reductase